jgi:dolichol-phosphate mannosyltransferase
VKVFVVLPAYNESEALPPLVQSLTAVLSGSGRSFRIVIVNDGSRDNTLAVARQLATQFPVDVLDNGVNKGLAETLKHGLNNTLNRCTPEDVIITMDGDNTHPAGLMLRMLTALAEGNDIAIASRYREGAAIRGLSLWRRFLSYGASWVFRLTFPTPGVRDYTCGYRAYKAQVLLDVRRKHGDQFISAQGFSCMVDLLLKLRSLNPIIVELPMVLRYDLKPGVSKMRVFKTIFETLGLITRRRLGLDRSAATEN